MPSRYLASAGTPVNYHNDYCACRLTYPTPPAGGDLATWVPEANTPPFRVTFTLPPGSILQGTDCVAARYSLETHSWVTEGYGPVSHDLSSGSVSFQSSTNGILAVLQKRTLLPYKEWCVRPTGGQYGGQAMVHVQTGDSQLYHVIGMNDVRDHMEMYQKCTHV